MTWGVNHKRHCLSLSHTSLRIMFGEPLLIQTVTRIKQEQKIKKKVLLDRLRSLIIYLTNQRIWTNKSLNFADNWFLRYRARFPGLIINLTPVKWICDCVKTQFLFDTETNTILCFLNMIWSPPKKTFYCRIIPIRFPPERLMLKKCLIPVFLFVISFLKWL